MRTAELVLRPSAYDTAFPATFGPFTVIQQASNPLSPKPGRRAPGKDRSGRWLRNAAAGLCVLARHDPQTQTVSLVLDDTTATIALFTIAAHADEREAHLREVERSGQNLPEGSYGRRNREAIAARETRAAVRLRAVEQAYRAAIDRGTTCTPTERTRTLRSLELQHDRQIDLEAEP